MNAKDAKKAAKQPPELDPKEITKGRIKILNRLLAVVESHITLLKTAMAKPSPTKENW